ncbi:hypothetical protein CcaverHIS631_0108270 [Cutaneotrichosporon cavernicola]|nr:hypothetical protein CcaverHIS631_0108270 [Cutaneotrichosporon cavernicola]
MSDYYMPRDGAQGIKRESTWRPKSQPSRPANAWADSPGPSGPTRKGEYYEPPRHDERSRERAPAQSERDKGKEPEDREEHLGKIIADDGVVPSAGGSAMTTAPTGGAQTTGETATARANVSAKNLLAAGDGRPSATDAHLPRHHGDATGHLLPGCPAGVPRLTMVLEGEPATRKTDVHARPPRLRAEGLPLHADAHHPLPRGVSPLHPYQIPNVRVGARAPGRPPRSGLGRETVRSPAVPAREGAQYATAATVTSGGGRLPHHPNLPQQQQQHPRRRDGDPVKMRVWGRPQTASPPRDPSPRRSRSRSRSRSPPREEVPRPVRPRHDPQPGDALPYDTTPDRDTPTNGEAAHPVRGAMRDWKPAPTGPAAQRNGMKEGPAKVPTQEDVPEVDMELDDEPPPPMPKRSDKWSPVKRSPPVRFVPPLPPSASTVSGQQSPASLPPPSGPPATGPGSFATRPAFVPRVPPPGPVSVTSAPSSAPSGPASGPGTPRAETFLNRLADKQQQYDKHLSTIAPYISTAFGQWYAKNATPPLHQFLIHHFGRQPSSIEMDQIHQLLRMRSQLSKDQQDLTALHAQAVRGEKATPAPPPDAPVGPRATRERDQVRVGGLPAGAGPSPPLGLPPFPVLVPAARKAPKPRPKPVVAPRPPRPRAVAGERYERLSQVGEGTYGKVYKARNTGSGALVALKRIRMEQERDGFPVTSMREIKLLQALDHPNIVRLMEMMVSHNSVYMVLEYMNHDLTGILSHPEVKLSPANVKSLNYQMLSGLGYLHRRGILHRDMKGSNILLNGEGELKLADFGLARWYHKHKRDDYTNRVITLWYRSPELLMGETAYGPEVDTWSAGCIMLEIFTGKPTFQGQDEISQLDAIWAILGTPRESDWPSVAELPWYELVRPREALPSRFAEKFSSLSAGAMEVVRGLLELNPAKRLLADDALDAVYFTTEAPEMEQPTQLATCGEHHEMTVKMHRRREK